MSSCFQTSTRIKSSRLCSLVDTLLEEGSVPEFQLFLQKVTCTDFLSFQRSVISSHKSIHTYYGGYSDIWRIKSL